MFRKKLFKILNIILTLFVSLFAVASPTYAEEPYTYISVKYSKGIDIQSTDVFTLTYEMKGQTGDATITISPSKIGENLGLINLPKGQYLITDISYEGSSNKILQQGYASVSSFSASSNGGDNIEIAVGSESVSRFLKKHPDAISKEGSSGEELPADTADESDSGDEMQETSKNTSQSKKPQKKKKETESSNSSLGSLLVQSISSLIPLCFIFIIGLVAIYVMHKKDKI